MLDKYLDSNNNVIINEDEWKYINSNIAPIEFRKLLAEFIVSKNLPFPYKHISYEDMRSNFLSFCNDNLKDWILQSDNVMEKQIREDLKYKYCGKGIIQLGHPYNTSSNYFHQSNRYSCDGHSIRSCVHRWKTGYKLDQLLSPLWRMNCKELNISEYHAAFRLGGYIATQFKPHVAKIIYSLNKSKVILDTSCGWGDRLAAFYATGTAQEYYGCDPNTDSYEMYKTQCVEYEKLLNLNQEPTIIDHGDWFECNGIKRVIIQNKPAEDIDWSIIPSIDCAFTSPPYFCTEQYAKGSSHESNQSWYRYKTYESWRDHFYLPTSDKTINKLSKNGWMYVNIMNPQIGKVYYPACEDLVDTFKDKFKGQYGMRIKQRPRNVDKLQTAELFKKIYIEPIWSFNNV